MTDSIQAYPLAWPPGWRRTAVERRKPHQFKHYRESLSLPRGVQRVLDELEKLSVKERDVVISTNVRPTLGGLPRSGERPPNDPGVAVYWTQGKERRCIASDAYTSVPGNLGAVAATLEAMRAIQRHGGAEILDRAFMGFTALPAPEQPWQVLGLETSSPTRAQVDEAYRRLAAQHHPDRQGGSHEQMARLNAARDALAGRS